MQHQQVIKLSLFHVYRSLYIYIYLQQVHFSLIDIIYTIHEETTSPQLMMQYIIPFLH